MSDSIARVGENFRASEPERRNRLQQLYREETQHLVATAKADALLVASLAGRKIAELSGAVLTNDQVLARGHAPYETLARRWVLFILSVHPDTNYSVRILSSATGMARASVTTARRVLRLDYRDKRLDRTLRPMQEICDQLARLGWTPFDVRSAL